jgi:tetratricopeptide (TPR) repeat protein
MGERESQGLSWITPDGKRIGAQEAEEILLGRVRQCEGALQGAVAELVHLYATTGRPHLVAEHIERFIACVSDPGRKAAGFVRMGVLMEEIQDFTSAASYYRMALALEPMGSDIWYWIHNNLGFSLNQLEKYGEAEVFCRAAIGIDPGRHNAHKNLGVSLAGQGKRLEAAKAFVTATLTNPADPRALAHLEELLAEHPTS